MRQRVVAASVLAAVTMAGCAMPTRNSSATGEPLRDVNAESNGEVHTDLIRAMLAKQQYYAALAHIQDQQRVRPTRELKLLEAEARRRLGQGAAADKLYRDLLGTEYDADAEHGIGLIAAGSDLKSAVQHLRSAVQRRPTDALFRNDLGYALMVSGRYREALPELATAVELDQSNTLGRNNLIMLLLLTHDEARAKQVASDSGVSDEQLASLRRQAQTLAKPR